MHRRPACAEGLDAKQDAPSGHKHRRRRKPPSPLRPDKTIEAIYGAPFLNHATLEPMNCDRAASKDGHVEIWVRNPERGRSSLAGAAEAGGVPLANVKVNKIPPGRRLRPPRPDRTTSRQAVLIAKQVPGHARSS